MPASASAAASAVTATAEDVDDDDPYLWLEDVEGEASLEFAEESNERCLEALGDPKRSGTGTYERVLAVLESDERIPHVSNHGTDPSTGEKVAYNFWKDGTNPKGLWRKTTLDEFVRTGGKPEQWTTVLDVDQLAEKDGVSWVWKGSSGLPRARDPQSGGKLVTRALLSLSRGGSDAVHVKEFDLIKGDFVDDQPFNLSNEAKSRVSYKSRDVLLVATDFGPESLTDSGYPRTVREWVRGTPLDDAPVVFEGDKKDVSVFAYVTDERVWNGGIYEVRGRSLDFYTSRYWVRKVQYEHLLAPDDPVRKEVCLEEPPEFVQVDVQDDASVDFVGNLLLISLRSDWQPVPDGPTYKKGSLLYTDTDAFLEKGSAESVYRVLFEPTERTAYEHYTLTKNYFILHTMDNVKAKLDFYKLGPDGSTLTWVGGNPEGQIHDFSVRPVDPFEGSDQFWFTSNGFETPSTLFLADAGKIEQRQAESEKQAIEPETFIESKIKSLPHFYDSSNVSVEQRMATSKDGTQIPYFIVMNKNATTGGKNPTLLYGYGGFEVSLGPHYIASQGIAWLERGGVYVEANIRGGGEFGPSWHQAGLKDKRHKCYEDFIAVAEHLIETGVCVPKSLAIRGGSNVRTCFIYILFSFRALRFLSSRAFQLNVAFSFFALCYIQGGLLMGNMYTMRPDLFGAIACAVPLL